MKKKPARQPRKIEVVEDAQVATKAEPKPRGKKAKPAPTDATPAVVDQPAASPEPNATVAKSGAKKGKSKAEAPAPEPATANKPKTKATAEATASAQSERKPEQPTTTARVAGKLSALDAAAQVLASSEPLNCKELIDAMAVQGLWTSPGGKTPHATPYSAILREITTKGDEPRFVKTERGRFARKGA